MKRPNSEIRVLIVDDSALSRRFLRALLTPAGYQIEEAAGLEEALAALEAGRVDLVLLDLLMPGVDDPVEGVCRVKAKAPHVPVVVSSGNVQARVQEAVIGAGAAGFVAKPVKTAELLLVIDSAISG